MAKSKKKAFNAKRDIEALRAELRRCTDTVNLLSSQIALEKEANVMLAERINAAATALSGR